VTDCKSCSFARYTCGQDETRRMHDEGGSDLKCGSAAESRPAQGRSRPFDVPGRVPVLRLTAHISLHYRELLEPHMENRAENRKENRFQSLFFSDVHSSIYPIAKNLLSLLKEKVLMQIHIFSAAMLNKGGSMRESPGNNRHQIEEFLLRHGGCFQDKELRTASLRIVAARLRNESDGGTIFKQAFVRLSENRKVSVRNVSSPRQSS
jgi:hypothetical protein